MEIRGTTRSDNLDEAKVTGLVLKLYGCLFWLSHFLVVPSQSFSIWSRRREKDRELGVQ